MLEGDACSLAVSDCVWNLGQVWFGEEANKGLFTYLSKQASKPTSPKVTPKSSLC